MNAPGAGARRCVRPTSARRRPTTVGRRQPCHVPRWMVRPTEFGSILGWLAIKRAARRSSLFFVVMAAGLLLVGCGGGLSATDTGTDRPPIGPGSPGAGGVALDVAFFQRISGAQSLDDALALLDRKCDDDPTIMDKEGCKAAVRQFLGSTPISLVGQNEDGCRAALAGGQIVLTGRDCVGTFHLVDAENKPLDPKSLPPGGRLPAGTGVARDAVKPAQGSTNGGTGTGDGGTRPRQYSPTPLPDDFFQRFENQSTLEDSIEELNRQCDNDERIKDKGDCKKQVLDFFRTAPVTLTLVDKNDDEGGCDSRWIDHRIVLKGRDCVEGFHLVDANGNPIDPTTLPPSGEIPTGIHKDAVHTPPTDEDTTGGTTGGGTTGGGTTGGSTTGCTTGGGGGTTGGGTTGGGTTGGGTSGCTTGGSTTGGPATGGAATGGGSSGGGSTGGGSTGGGSTGGGSSGGGSSGGGSSGGGSSGGGSSGGGSSGGSSSGGSSSGGSSSGGSSSGGSSSGGSSSGGSSSGGSSSGGSSSGGSSSGGSSSGGSSSGGSSSDGSSSDGSTTRADLEWVTT